MPLNIPILLTWFRIVMIPVFIGIYYLPDATLSLHHKHLFGALLFVFAAITDWLDGYLARIWDQQSALGRMLDPIADKLLVGAVLLMLVYDGTISGWSIWAAVIILSREILVSGLREFLAELNVKIHVTQLAKWKTTFQFIALALLLAGPATRKFVPDVAELGLFILWISAVLTLFTGYDYLKAGIRHAMER